MQGSPSMPEQLSDPQSEQSSHRENNHQNHSNSNSNSNSNNLITISDRQSLSNPHCSQPQPQLQSLSQNPQQTANTNASHTSSTDKKNLYSRYTNYIDSSECTIEHYRQQRFFPGQEKYIHKINSWIEDDLPDRPNKPLVFKTEPGCGIKTILVNWQKSLNSKAGSRSTGSPSSNLKEKTLSIMHFASNGSNNRNYFYSLYRIIIKLREALKLKQNVDLLQENIRKFFSYWLDICSSEVEKQLIIYCSQNIYSKIVIVIEGVDQFLDNDNSNNCKEANIAFWLPEVLPKNVKVIVTAAKGSQSLAHLEKIKCEVIEVKPNADISSFLLTNALQQASSSGLPQDVEQKYKDCLQGLVEKIGLTNNTYSFIEGYRGAFLAIMAKFNSAASSNKNTKERGVFKEIMSSVKDSLTKKMDWQKLGSLRNVKELYEFLIEFWTQQSPLKSRLNSVLTFLCLTQKGLTAREVLALTKVTESEWNYFLVVFNFVIIKYEGIYSIKSTSFVQMVLERDRVQKLKSNPQMTATLYQQETVIEYHEKLANALESTGNSIRKLEEQTYHLFAAKSYFKLKEMVSNIENFLLMFNPNNKYELSKYWQRLEEKGFDPVIEYNKAVEGFAMHYHPSDENTFRIIVQISRFLKEFCDFETYHTPTFRHPYIEGNAVELHKVGLLKEFADLDIFYDNSFNNHEELLDLLDDEFDVEREIQELREKYFPKESTTGADSGLEGQTAGSDTNPSFKDPSQNQRHHQTHQREKSTSPTSKMNGMMKDLDDVMGNRKRIKKKNGSNVKILSDIEQLNVDVPMNREKFRNYYLKMLQQYMKKDGANGDIVGGEGSCALNGNDLIMGGSGSAQYDQKNSGCSGANMANSSSPNNGPNSGGSFAPSPYTPVGLQENVYLDVDEIYPTSCSGVASQNHHSDLMPYGGHSSNSYSYQKLNENYKMRQIKPSLYYYKRWIWIQFPWVCISLNNNYSTTPELCKKIEGDDFDTLQQEAKYTKQALLVAIEAREKKRQMFTKKDNSYGGDSQLMNSTSGGQFGSSGSKIVKGSNNVFMISSPSSKFHSNGNATVTGDVMGGSASSTSGFMNHNSRSKFGSRGGSGTVMSQANGTSTMGFGSKSMATATAVPDMSLNALTKDLQSRKKRLNLLNSSNNNNGSSLMPLIHKENSNQLITQPPSEEIFLSEINENCQQDMKFISLRKQFQAPTMEGVEPNEILPKLKWSIKEHTNYELNYIKAHIEEKKKKLNKIIYENKKLGEVYQELKLKENMAKKGDCGSSGVEAENRRGGLGKKNRVLEDLVRKKEEAISEFCRSLLQKERLKIILKLCSENKTKNEEYLASLNYLLQNLKKMISFEKENMKAITEELEEIKALRERQNLMESEKQRNQQIVEKEAQNYLGEKQKLERQIENITAVISEDIREQKDRLEHSLSGHLKSKEEKSQLLMEEKKTKLLEERLQRLEQEYQGLRDLFQFEGFDFESAPKFKRLMEENERNKKLKIAYFERKNRLEQVMREYEQIKAQSEKEAQEEIKKLSMKKEGEKGQLQRSHLLEEGRVQSEDKYAIILDNIALKLGVKDKHQIVGVLKEKLEMLRIANPQKYQELTGKPSGLMASSSE